MQATQPTLNTRAKKARRESASKVNGMKLTRYFSSDRSPYACVTWEVRDVAIQGAQGHAYFKQEGVEVPAHWSMLATQVVASKYFRGKLGNSERESSVRQIIERVTKTLGTWGYEQGYFEAQEDQRVFEDELATLLLDQRLAFNSPVWFNMGVEKHPQCSACFINSVDDSMSSILELAKTEGMLFKGGSGAGCNLSRIRSSREHLSSGGKASGPVSFMKGFDAFAGAIKSGGTTRRAAKMVILDIDHPDVLEFIRCKELEEKKAWALMDAGYDGSFNGEAYESISYQNANNSVRVSDAFMRAVEEDTTWTTHAILDKAAVDTYPARDLLKAMAHAAWVCGDPGIQYDDTINRWHTCANTDRIYASNPCSEYMFLNDSACNLASLNLMSFLDDAGNFDIPSFQRACELSILAQEIMVDQASYPTEAIKANSQRYRPLGLGYANLGALLMSKGLPYDSDEGRDYAAAITALMTGQAYLTSAQIAEHRGSFEGYADNAEPMQKVIHAHHSAAKKILYRGVAAPLKSAVSEVWTRAEGMGLKQGYRNAQVTVLAPTGTIGFMMDCDTTGIEPDIALVKYKSLVGGGQLKLVNRGVGPALHALGYNPTQTQEILVHISETDGIEGAPHLEDRHLAVFDCAFKSPRGHRSIHYKGHLRMMAAVQPFLSGAISKTVNLPHEATDEDIMNVYLDGWRMGLKSVAVYRDGSKRTQPVSTRQDQRTEAAKTQDVAKDIQRGRRKLPDERHALTHKFCVAGHEGYITVGLYDDGTPGEIFLVMSKEGTVVSGMMDAFATAISMALQYGVPLRVLIEKFSHMRFEPSGMTQNREIPFAKSVVDYVFRWLASKFLPKGEHSAVGVLSHSSPAPEPIEKVETLGDAQAWLHGLQEDAPPCSDCGSIMVRNGVCYKCLNCGGTSGCS